MVADDDVIACLELASIADHRHSDIKDRAQEKRKAARQAADNPQRLGSRSTLIHRCTRTKKQEKNVHRETIAANLAHRIIEPLRRILKKFLSNCSKLPSSSVSLSITEQSLNSTLDA